MVSKGLVRQRPQALSPGSLPRPSARQTAPGYRWSPTPAETPTWGICSVEKLYCSQSQGNGTDGFVLFSLQGKAGWRHGSSRLRIVVIVENGFRRLSRHRESSLQRKGKRRATGMRPEIEDHAIRLKFIALQVPAIISDGEVQVSANYLPPRSPPNFTRHPAES